MASMRLALLFLCLLASRAAAGLPPVPPADTAGDSAAGRALLQACLNAHGGMAAYARLRDVNVRLEGKWAFLAPKLQPVLADVRFRGGSEERYLRGGRRTFVAQVHRGPAGVKYVSRPANPAGGSATTGIFYNGQASTDREALAAASLVTDAYTMFLFGPEFFAQRSAPVTKLSAAADVDGRACDEVLAVLHPGFGEAKEDRDE